MVRIINAFNGDNPIGSTLAQLGSQLWGDQAGDALRREQVTEAQRTNAETANLMRLVSEQGVQTLGSNPTAQAMIIGSGYAPDDFGYLGRMGAATEYGARDPRTTNWQVGVGQPYSQTAEAFDLDLGEVTRNNNLQSGDRRYATDVGATTTLATNDADNLALVGMNNDDNAAALAEQNALPIEAVDPVTGLPMWTTQGAPAGQPVLTETEALGTAFGRMFPTMPPEAQLEALNATPPLVETVGPDGTVVRTPQANAAGMPVPIDPYTMTPGDQRRGQGNEIVAEMPATPPTPGTTWNYLTPDGQSFITTDRMAAVGLAADGTTRLPPGGSRAELTGGAGEIGLTNAVQTDVQSDEIALQKFNTLADRMQTLLNDPNSQWGVVGWAQNKLQEIAQALGTAWQTVRPQDAAAVQQWLPEIYNPNLPAQETLHIVMLYAGAAALASQEGRSVTDRDIAMMRTAIPNPLGLFTSREMMQAKLDEVRAIIGGFSTVNQGVLNNGVGGAPAQPPAAPPQQGVPAATVPAPDDWQVGDRIQMPDGQVMAWDGAAFQPVAGPPTGP